MFKQDVMICSCVGRDIRVKYHTEDVKLVQSLEL